MRRKLLRVLAGAVVLKALAFAWCAPPGEGDAESRLAYLSSELRAAQPGAGTTAGEWHLVALSMTGLAAANQAFRHPETRAERLALVESLTSRALEKSARRFDTRAWGADALQTLAAGEGHVGYLGHLGLLLSTECTLGGRAHDAERRAVIGALERRFLAAPDGLIDTYPGEAWVPDNAVALAAVALGARCEGRSAPQVLARWPKDARTGLLRFTRRAGPRGSGAGWSSIYLPFVDEAFARSQFEAAQRTFGWSALGLAAWREYPDGAGGSGDVDSGPLVFGLSPAGTGFAIAGATRYDAPLQRELLRTAEAAGTTVNLGGGRHYLFSPLVGDASVLAAKTATAWDSRYATWSVLAATASRSRTVTSFEMPGSSMVIP